MNDPVIVGWAHTPFGRLEEAGVEQLIARVAGSALEHAGIPASSVDGIFTGVFNAGFSCQSFDAALVALTLPELAHIPATRLENACATGSAALFGALDFMPSLTVRLTLKVPALAKTWLTGDPVAVPPSPKFHV